MTDERLVELERLCVAAAEPLFSVWWQDPHFLTAVQIAVPELLAEIRRLRGVIDRWERAVGLTLETAEELAKELP